MKANAGGSVDREAIIGRENVINEIWEYLDRRSVMLTSERRIGKTSIMKKMRDNPRSEYIPILCYVEKARHPIDCVKIIFSEVDQLRIREKKWMVFDKFKDGWNMVASTGEFGNWKLPQIQDNWKHLIDELFSNIAENSELKLLIMLDEFPHMINNIAQKEGADLALEFLDTLRALRQRWEDSGKIRFILSGSIGFHLVMKQLRIPADYKGRPTNNMQIFTVTGMTEIETEHMCDKYLTDEEISMEPIDDFKARMFERTEGLPLYIQHICEKLQMTRKSKPTVTPSDIDSVLEKMMNDTEIEWFRDTKDRINDYYTSIGMDRIAHCVLDELSRREESMSETDIIEYVKSQIEIEDNNTIKDTLELLRQDHYLKRDTPDGKRFYRFTYRLMREWWLINRG